MSEQLFTTILVIFEIFFSLMLLKTLKKAGANNYALFILGSLLTVWLVSVYIMLATGFFTASGIPRLAFTAGVFAPVVLGLFVYWRSKGVSAVINNIPSRDYLVLQHFRAVFGVMFFFTTAIPVWFQYLGGLGDITAGVGAFFALRYLNNNPDKERNAIFRGNIPGIIDFIIVLNVGVFVVLKDQSPDNMFDLIPLYLVPIFILLHIFSLRKLSSL